MYSSRRSGGAPAWFVFLIGLAVVFGAFRIWTGVQGFFADGGGSFPTTTPNSEVRATAAANETNQPVATRFPTNTPQPTCQTFVVRAGAGTINVRRQATTLGVVEQTITEGTAVCVLALEGDWYRVDMDVNTRRIEEGFIFAELLDAQNPTPTPSDTALPAPTITLTPTVTPSYTPTP